MFLAAVAELEIPPSVFVETMQDLVAIHIGKNPNYWSKVIYMFEKYVHACTYFFVHAQVFLK